MHKLFEYMYINWNFDYPKVTIGVLGQICMSLNSLSRTRVKPAFVVQLHNNCIFRIPTVFVVLLCQNLCCIRGLSLSTTVFQPHYFTFPNIFVVILIISSLVHCLKLACLAASRRNLLCTARLNFLQIEMC